MGYLGSCGKTFVIVFTLFALGCSIGATLRPLYWKVDVQQFAVIFQTITLWEVRERTTTLTKAQTPEEDGVLVVKMSDISCLEFRDAFILAQVFAISTVILVGLGAIAGLLHFWYRVSRALVLTVIFLALVSSVLALSFSVNGWAKGFCDGTYYMIEPLKQTYSMQDGIALQVLSIGSCLVVLFLELLT